MNEDYHTIDDKFSPMAPLHAWELAFIHSLPGLIQRLVVCKMLACRCAHFKENAPSLRRKGSLLIHAGPSCHCYIQDRDIVFMRNRDIKCDVQELVQNRDLKCCAQEMDAKQRH